MRKPPLKVRPFDGPLRFLVASNTRPEIEHVAELDTYDGLGRCSCEHFEFRSEPLASRGAREAELRCRHIRAARTFLRKLLAKKLENPRLAALAFLQRQLKARPVSPTP